MTRAAAPWLIFWAVVLVGAVAVGIHVDHDLSSFSFGALTR